MNSRSSLPLAAMLAVASLMIAPVYGEEARALLEQHKCNRCHSERGTGTGPAYVDVSAKYRGDAKAAVKLAALIRQGWRGAAPWHMPPHPEISNADASAIAKYILSIRE